MPPPYIAFGGAGASLGGSGAAPAVASAVVRPGAPGAAAAATAAAVDPTQPATTLQVKLVDGRRERLQMNLGHTVADLQARVLR